MTAAQPQAAGAQAETTAARPDAAPAWSDPGRERAFQAWIAAIGPTHALRPETLRAASADASSRRYFRIDGAAPGGSFIVMDSPAAEDSAAAFVHVAGLIQAAGLHGPQVLAFEPEHGFMLLDDLGDTPYLAALSAAAPPQADALMRDAIAALVQWQLRVDAAVLPPYDEALLRREIELFPTWCVQREHARAWSGAEQAIWDEVSGLLLASALAQPTVAVHRDWMPRNLMVARPNPGVLDFQDAVRGPITYDLASLLRDAFISWDEERELDWAVRYWQQARAAGLPVEADFGEFWRAAEWMGLQRHLKVIGIFCRLKHRDAKPHYSTDVPRFFAYASRVANRYGPLRPLLRLLEPLAGTPLAAGFTF